MTIDYSPTHGDAMGPVAIQVAGDSRIEVELSRTFITVHIPNLPHTTVGRSGTVQIRRGVLNILEWKSSPGYSLPNRMGDP